MSDDLNIGRTLKVLRVSAGLKQMDLAKKIDVSPNYLSLLEAGRKEPSLSLLKRISRALDVPLSFLVWDSSDRKGPLSHEQQGVYLRLRETLLDFERLRLGRSRSRQTR